MPKYVVTLEEVVTYDVTVEAANEDEAKAAAEEAFVQSDDINEFWTVVSEREASNVELLQEAGA